MKIRSNTYWFNHKLLMKIFRNIILGFLALIVIAAIGTFTTVDRTELHQTEFYAQMQNWLADYTPDTEPQYDSVYVGWAKVNLTPSQPLATAGYGNRDGKPYQSVHDSIYVRAMVFDNGRKFAMVSCDLLIIPPEVRLSLQDRLGKIGFSWEHVFIGATHTHNSIGAWGKNAIGELFAGKYHPEVVEDIANKIVKAIQLADANTTAAEIGYGQIDTPELVFNRLVHEKGTVDPTVRLLKIHKDNGQNALICVYSAHATTLNADKMVLSRDYPGVLVDKLEKDQADFAMFMAGSVGSTGPIGEEMKDDYAQLNRMADGLYQKIAKINPQIKTALVDNLHASVIPLSMRAPQVRVSQDLRFRPWVFQTFFGEYPAEMKVFQLGNTIFVGTPCDFSGELMPEVLKTAQAQHLNLMVTSFDGSYVGYITEDSHYDLNSYETRVMNWYGPQNGQYFQEIINSILIKNAPSVKIQEPEEK
ncbi:MAG: neutral/alkaline non-lysosomal ceramidase N-terminal domain-containing protein [Flectobacillus sp.]|uniref:neutral/alkaline non-lysosomal ceramidase N-terminal domain-containing protein n=1 Tax=Flectobacillus sp. TaxID=50419 RepID=UPI003B9DBEB0